MPNNPKEEMRFKQKFKICENGCWNWTASTNGKNGYGKMYFRGRLRLAHVISHILLKGEVPIGLVVDHLCRNRLCVNPEHLSAITQKDNMLKGNAPMAINKRKTYCSNGHPLFGPRIKIKVRKDGVRRRCMDCALIEKKRSALRKRIIKHGK